MARLPKTTPKPAPMIALITRCTTIPTIAELLPTMLAIVGSMPIMPMSMPMTIPPSTPAIAPGTSPAIGLLFAVAPCAEAAI